MENYGLALCGMVFTISQPINGVLSLRGIHRSG